MNMKREYIKPEMQEVQIQHQGLICISPMQSVNTNLEVEDELIWGGGGIVEGR